MPRRKYGPQDRARALALAEAIGPSAAARQLGVRTGTVTGWVSKARNDPESFAAEVEVGSALVAAATGGLTLAELEGLQRRVATQLDAALDSGRSLDSQRLAVILGIVVDKCARQREREPPRDESERAQSLIELVRANFPEVVDHVAEVKQLRGEIEQLRAENMVLSAANVTPREQPEAEVVAPPSESPSSQPAAFEQPEPESQVEVAESHRATPAPSFRPMPFCASATAVHGGFAAGVFSTASADRSKRKVAK